MFSVRYLEQNASCDELVTSSNATEIDRFDGLLRHRHETLALGGNQGVSQYDMLVISARYGAVPVESLSYLMMILP